MAICSDSGLSIPECPCPICVREKLDRYRAARRSETDLPAARVTFFTSSSEESTRSDADGARTDDDG